MREDKFKITEQLHSFVLGFFLFWFVLVFFLKPRRSSKDFYIEVSPGTYSVTAISEDMVEQTHVIDVNAGQTIDVTFVLWYLFPGNSRNKTGGSF